jgi:hypothetical protein
MIRPTADRALALLFLIGLASPAAAAVPIRAPAVQTVLDCRKLADSPARLACYDRSVDDMVKAEIAGDLVTIDREQRGALRKQTFGFNIPAINLFDRDKQPREDDRLFTKVESASQDGLGRWTIRLEGGAVWAQTDDSPLYPDPHSGSPVVIRQGVLGAFFMSIDGMPGVRAVRRQ